MSIPITTVTGHIDMTIFQTKDSLPINSNHLKGAVIEYIFDHLIEDLGKKEISPAQIFNKDEHGVRKVSYPLIQFDLSPSGIIKIVGICQGSKTINLWINRIYDQQDLKIKGKKIIIKFIHETCQLWRPELLPHLQVYEIRKWKPYSTDTLKQRKPLDNIIWGQLLRITDDLDIKLARRPRIDLLRYKEIQRIDPYDRSHKIRWRAFNGQFATNINFPNNIGVGHEARLGFGKIKKLSSISL